MRSSRRYERSCGDSRAPRSNQTTLPCFACAGTAQLLADVDLDAPVARLVDVVGGRHEKLALAAAGGLDLHGGNADLDKEALYPLGTPCRQQIVPRGHAANGLLSTWRSPPRCTMTVPVCPSALGRTTTVSSGGRCTTICLSGLGRTTTGSSRGAGCA